MLLTKIYNEETKTEEAWFDSSMIIYTKMVEDPNENKGELYITYKGGATYVYHDVLFQDYVVFLGGGTDGSHGKTINKIIKGKYEFEKLEPISPEYLSERMSEVIEKKREEALALANDYPKKWEILKIALKSFIQQMENEEQEPNAEINKFLYDEYLEILRTILTNVDDD
jgi:hypothetical protein